MLPPVLLMKLKYRQVDNVDRVNYETRQAWYVVHHAVKLRVQWRMPRPIDRHTVPLLAPTALLYVEMHDLLTAATNISKSDLRNALGKDTSVGARMVADVVNTNIGSHWIEIIGTTLPVR